MTERGLVMKPIIVPNVYVFLEVKSNRILCGIPLSIVAAKFLCYMRPSLIKALKMVTGGL